MSITLKEEVSLPILYRSEDEGVILSPDALVARHEALQLASGITAVTSPEDESLAVAAQAGLTKLVKATDKQRKEITKPLDDLKKEIMATADSFMLPLKDEEVRIARLVGDYAAARLARERAALASTNATLSAIEQERELALAAAATLEERDRIQEEYDAKVRSVPAVETHRAEGQVIRREWDVQVLDVHALYRAHPNCCKITPLMSEIKALLDDGIAVRGVKAERIVKSGVRTT